ncbi:hypothetical protein [Rouxiella sp. WC2420]|uniref:Uncharacterized protein n=1 Tax=Rouxiella sp. WC2420 TaxID=3234145 RepID=A0AB39VPW4_9GAMM
MAQSELKPVLLTRTQIDAINQIQCDEQNKSQLGIAPDINVIARQLIDLGLSQLYATSKAGE